MVNFAIIGCGRISGKHIGAIKQTVGAKIVAVCDIVEERAKKTASELGCKHYTDYNLLLQDPMIDVVNLCTPSGLHPEMTVKAARSGKSVVCEKPIAMIMSDASKMINECRQNKVSLFIIKQNRYNPPIVSLKKAIDEGRFGRIFLANVTVRWSRDQKYYDQDAWRGKILTDGGVLLNQTSHHIDMLRWLMGDVESVICKKATYAHDIETEDTAVAIFKFKNGAMATFEGTTCTFPRDLEGSISVLGEKGSAKVGGFAMNKMDVWQFTDMKEEDSEITHAITNPPNVYGFGHIPFMFDVVKSLQANKAPKIDGEEGIKTLKVIIAMLKSAKLGREVFVDEITNEDNTYYY